MRPAAVCFSRARVKSLCKSVSSPQLVAHSAVSASCCRNEIKETECESCQNQNEVNCVNKISSRIPHHSCHVPLFFLIVPVFNDFSNFKAYQSENTMLSQEEAVGISCEYQNKVCLLSKTRLHPISQGSSWSGVWEILDDSVFSNVAPSQRTLNYVL
ncbi:uncharacterized protein LOC144376333 [Ictidomys tridecemlineatus]